MSSLPPASGTAERRPLEAAAMGQREYLQAVASLNNHAVQLLTQGSFIDGSQRLKEAAKLIKDMARYWDGDLTETELRRALVTTDHKLHAIITHTPRVAYCCPKFCITF
jgi:hypothetical protein